MVYVGEKDLENLFRMALILVAVCLSVLCFQPTVVYVGEEDLKNVFRMALILVAVCLSVLSVFSLQWCM